MDFPLEREPEEAWPHFVGWRANYEHAAYALTAPMAPMAPGPGVLAG